jgi:TonB family protein
MVLPLRVWLNERAGEGFPGQWAHTIEISHIGCRLGGLRSELTPGQTITLQRGQHKAPFRVIWSKHLADNENQAGIEALDYEKDIWAVELPPSPIIPKQSASVRPTTSRKLIPAAANHPRIRWGVSFLLFVLTLGLFLYREIFYQSGSVAIHPPVPAVPTAQDLARLTPKPRPALIPITRALDTSASRLQVAETPTGRIVYPVPPADGIVGQVRLQIVIAANGLVKQIHAISGKQSLAQAAAQAVRFWRYNPFPGSDGSTERETTVTVSFLGPDAVSLQFPPSNAAPDNQASKQE